MIIQSSKELEIGSIARAGFNDCICYFDDRGDSQVLFAMLVIRRSNKDELRQDLQELGIGFKEAQLIGPYYYEVSID